ncbi:MAG: phosphomannomutase/phosphoglucomutase [Lautropia sp.]|nr:phosphomannomutase/phosphoglucomutase [Lautropia sp.]
MSAVSLPPVQAPNISPTIFKAYDIRGVVDTALTEEVVSAIGLVLGARACKAGIASLVVGRDGRLSGPRLAAALAAGICAGGVDVIDIGMVPTPLVYFATVLLGNGSGVAVTGSHNPPDYNGLKMMMAGDTFHGADIQDIAQTVADPERYRALFAERPGRVIARDVVPDYLARVAGEIQLQRPLKVVVDAGNGVAGVVGPALLRAIGVHDLVELYCEIDGHFPNHHPDPARPENLRDLMAAVQQHGADIGLAFDGDGDRLGVVTRSGQVIFPDRQAMLYAASVLESHPGATIIYDIKCTRNLAPWIRERGGVPLMWRTGHSLIKAKMKETGAKFAGEMSGHIFFNDRWYGFDDGLYTAARLLEILAREADPGAMLEALPDSFTTSELQIAVGEGEGPKVVEKLQKDGSFEGALEILTIDGLRIEYADGFGLVRASNTTPVLVLRFEADSPEALVRIQRQFRQAILSVRPDVQIPF